MLFLGGADNRDLDRDISAVFAELSLPITDSFQAQLAARYEDYGGGIGSTFDPKLSLRWQLVDCVRAARLGRNYIPRPGADSRPTRAASRRCRTWPARSARSARSAIRTSSRRARLTFNVGMLVKAGGFSGSLDYWSFDFEDQIVNEPVAGITNFVFGTGAACVGGLANPLAGRFAFRDGNSDGVINDADCTTANIQRLDINVFNGPDVKTDGHRPERCSSTGTWAAAPRRSASTRTYVLKYDIEPSIVERQHRCRRRSTPRAS